MSNLRQDLKMYKQRDTQSQRRLTLLQNKLIVMESYKNAISDKDLELDLLTNHVDDITTENSKLQEDIKLVERQLSLHRRGSSYVDLFPRNESDDGDLETDNSMFA